MKKIFCFLIIFLLIATPSFAVRKACLTDTDSVISSMLSAFGMDVTTSCTTNFNNYNIVVDPNSLETSGIRTTGVPAIIFDNDGGNVEWKFTDGNSDVETGQDSLLDAGNPGTINDGVASNPTVYSSTGTISWVEDSGSTGVVNNDAFDIRFAGQTAIFYWDTTDTDSVSVSYQQKGVFSGLLETGKWNNAAKRIFNNSVAYVCPFCADECIPPETGSWEINKTCNLKNQDINITGNITIQENGFLNLTGSGGYLNFIGTNRFIFMDPGSELSLDISATIGKDPI